MIQSLTISQEGKPSLLSRASGFVTDKTICNCLRHTISSVNAINTKNGEEVSFANPVKILISIIFVCIGVLAAGPLTQLMQQYYTNDEYRLVLPGNLREMMLYIIVIWLAYVNMIKMGYKSIGSEPMKSYLQVTDFYFKTHTVYQSILEPFIYGKGDNFVLGLYETGQIAGPTLFLMGYATLRAAGSTIMQQFMFPPIVNLVMRNFYSIPKMQTQAQTAIFQYGCVTLFMVSLVLVWQNTWSDMADMRFCQSGRDWYLYLIQLSSLVIAILTRPVG